MKWHKGKKRCNIWYFSHRDLYVNRKSRGRSRKRTWAQKQRNHRIYITMVSLCLLAVSLLFLKERLVVAVSRREVSAGPTAEETPMPGKPGSPPSGSTGTKAPDGIERLLSEADWVMAQYDYEKAAEILTADENNAGDPRIAEKLADIEAAKAALVEQDITKIPHVFFHILVEDPERTFLDTRQGKGYNSVMTTVPEFEKILEQMYQRGYVLVSLHDMAGVIADEIGQEKMEKKKILLPPGKKAFVMSQDDVNYYEYMEGSGCADKMLLDKDGKPVCEYVDWDKTVKTGSYDLVPILDDFVEKHPDFSYRGAKAVLALTGYNGVLGYRTDESYDAASPNYDPDMKANPNIEADRAYVKKLTQALKEDGYEFASHSWGHRDYGKIELEHMKADIDRWERNVAPLLPEPCDTMIYPFGSDVEDWKLYADNNEKYQYLHSLGFRYFCNVDSRPCWVQTDDRFLRQARRNLDGYRLWMDYGGGEERLSDLIDVKEVFDVRRPTPIGLQ